MEENDMESLKYKNKFISTNNFAKKLKIDKIEMETVLVLQGGGSLGAYECGVLKHLYKKGILFDVLAGSSIGAVNTSIIASAQNTQKDVAQVLEEFWLTLSENALPSQQLPSWPFFFSDGYSDKAAAILSSMQTIAFGVSNAFLPKWFELSSTDYCLPFEWTFLYDPLPLKKTLKDFIDTNALKENRDIQNDNSDTYHKAEKGKARLIMTATDIQNGEPVIFDNAYMDIDIDKIIACIGYPFYGIKWSIADKKYLWDGSLLTNTPLMEVMKASPVRNKEFYIVDVFPRKQKQIPTNMVEVWHRARDIIFMDKTDKNIEMLKITEQYINLLKKIYEIVNSDDAQIDDMTKKKIMELDSEYMSLTKQHGAAITNVIRIGRKEKYSHYMFEDADFSKYRVKKLIEEGERDASMVAIKDSKTANGE